MLPELAVDVEDKVDTRVEVVDVDGVINSKVEPLLLERVLIE